jgi:hypothetical protein
MMILRAWRLQKTKTIKIALEIICRQQKLLALEKNFKEKIKTTCSGNNLQKTKKKTCSRNLQKTENLALELFCRKKTILIWKFAESKKLGLNVCRKQETWSRNLLSWSDDGGGKTLGGLLGVQCTAAAVRGDLSLSLFPT